MRPISVCFFFVSCTCNGYARVCLSFVAGVCVSTYCTVKNVGCLYWSVSQRWLYACMCVCLCARERVNAIVCWQLCGMLRFWFRELQFNFYFSLTIYCLPQIKHFFGWLCDHFPVFRFTHSFHFSSLCLTILFNPQ